MSINFHLTTGIDADIDEESFSEDGPQDPFERAAISGITDLLDLIQMNGIVVTVTIDGVSRQFDVNVKNNDVIEYPMVKRLYALLTNDGTACPETVLTDEEYAEPTRRAAVESRARHTQGADAPVPGTWTDVTDNDAINKENQ